LLAGQPARLDGQLDFPGVGLLKNDHFRTCNGTVGVPEGGQIQGLPIINMGQREAGMSKLHSIVVGSELQCGRLPGVSGPRSVDVPSRSNPEDDVKPERLTNPGNCHVGHDFDHDRSFVVRDTCFARLRVTLLGGHAGRSGKNERNHRDGREYFRCGSSGVVPSHPQSTC